MLLSGSTAEIKQPEHRYFGGHGGQGRDKTNIVMAWVYGQAPIDLASNLFALASNLLLTCTETLALPSTLLASRPGNGSTVHLCLHCTVLLQMKSGCSLKNGLENEFWTSMRVCRPRKIWWEKSCRRREGISGAWRRKKKQRQASWCTRLGISGNTATGREPSNGQRERTPVQIWGWSRKNWGLFSRATGKLALPSRVSFYFHVFSFAFEWSQ